MPLIMLHASVVHQLKDLRKGKERGQGLKHVPAAVRPCQLLAQANKNQTCTEPIPPATALLTTKGIEMGLTCTCILFKLAPGKQGADCDRGNSTLRNLLFSFPLHNPGEVQVVRLPTQKNIFSIISSVHLQTDAGAFSGSTPPVAPGCSLLWGGRT